jgi:hypothetical protein
VFAGGIADKLGNRYEAKWLVRQLLDVIGGKAQAVRYEGINASFDGFEFAVRRGDVVEWHQTKINNPNGNWTVAALQREGVLSAFKARLSADDSSRCLFISQDPANDIGRLSEKARIASDFKEYQAALGKGHTEKFNELQRNWAVVPQDVFSWLRRCEFRVESQSAIESVIASFSDFYFFKAGDTAFSTLREFLEVRINKDITTENARSAIRAERKLILKDWSIDPTLKERLFDKTAEYLETYIPFGAGGSTIPRVEAGKMLNRIVDPAGPSVILLTGVAGSGKSGVIREFIEQLVPRHRGFDSLSSAQFGCGFGVGAAHFGAGFFGCEHPFDASAFSIAALLPGRGFGGEPGVAVDASIEALAGQDADLDLHHVEPAGVLGDVVELQTAQDASCFVGREGLVECAG